MCLLWLNSSARRVIASQSSRIGNCLKSLSFTSPKFIMCSADSMSYYSYPIISSLCTLLLFSGSCLIVIFSHYCFTWSKILSFMWIISLLASENDFANNDKNRYTYFNTNRESPLKSRIGCFDSPIKFSMIGCKSLFFMRRWWNLLMRDS